MNDKLNYYLERMGYMPNYKFPEFIEEDSQFAYYKFRVPRHYIRQHIDDGDVWPNYKETTEKGNRDESVVLGVGFFPVYSGVELLDEDADFLYYKVKVPKLFLETPISGTNYTYSILYETQDYRLKTPEELAEEKSKDIPCAKIPKAGEQMPDRKELTSVRNVKESDVLLYEVVFYCSNGCGIENVPEVGSELWDLLYSRSCAKCGNRQLELISCKPILKDKTDD